MILTRIQCQELAIFEATVKPFGVKDDIYCELEHSINYFPLSENMYAMTSLHM